MRKIIVPTDFSNNAYNALEYACNLFRHERSQFYILHTYEDEVFNSVETNDRESLEEKKESVRKKANLELERITSRIEDHLDNSKHYFKTMSAFGLLIDEVNDLAERENADLIVTSTRGLSNDRQLTFGSNTLQIIKYVQCPVLSIPSNYQFSDPNQILFPTNYLLPYQKRELELVGNIARSFSSEVNMLYVSRIALETFRQRTNKEVILDQLKEVKVKFHHEELLEKTEAIEKKIRELDIDLLILVNSRHSYLENILYTSTIDKIGLNPKIPFLVLQNFHRF